MQALEIQREYFQTGDTLSFSLRKNALLSLKHQLKLHEKELLRALTEDLGKSEFEFVKILDCYHPL